MFCRICGTKIPDDSRFCTKCGTAVILSEQPVKQKCPCPTKETVSSMISSKVFAKVHTKNHVAKPKFSFFKKVKRNLLLNCRRFSSNWHTYNARSTRTEFWFFYILLAIIGEINIYLMTLTLDNWVMLCFGLLVVFFLFILNYNLMVRRLHDIGKGHMWAIIYVVCVCTANHCFLPGQRPEGAVIPGIIALYVLFLTLKPSVGPNKYGDPYPETIKERPENEKVG